MSKSEAGDSNEEIIVNEVKMTKNSSKKILDKHNTKGLVPIPYKPRKKKKLHRKHKRFGKRKHGSNIASKLVRKRKSFKTDFLV